MTNFFNFDDLTWDEVANLPRDISKKSCMIKAGEIKNDRNNPP
jgi:hypothetical protein